MTSTRPQWGWHLQVFPGAPGSFSVHVELLDHIAGIAVPVHGHLPPKQNSVYRIYLPVCPAIPRKATKLFIDHMRGISSSFGDTQSVDLRPS